MQHNWIVQKDRNEGGRWKYAQKKVYTRRKAFVHGIKGKGIGKKELKIYGKAGK